MVPAQEQRQPWHCQPSQFLLPEKHAQPSGEHSVQRGPQRGVRQQTRHDPDRPGKLRPQPFRAGTGHYLQAVIMISTSTEGVAISAWTQARTGAPSFGSQGVQTSFIAPRSLMSFTQMTA